MTYQSLSRHIDRDERRKERASNGSILAKRGSSSMERVIHYGGVVRRAFTVKPSGAPIPEGAVVIAVERNAHGQYRPVMICAYEGDKDVFTGFLRQAMSLGATELHLGGMDQTPMHRASVVRELSGLYLS